MHKCQVKLNNLTYPSDFFKGLGSRSVYFLAIWLGCVLLASSPLHAKRVIWGEYQKIIAIDPGHGGRDKGAAGLQTTFEKSITLSVARFIQSELEKKYQTLLTRNDDYSLDILERTALANQAGAALMISVHTGASFSRQKTGITIYYYDEMTKLEPSSVNQTPKKQPVNNDDLVQWDTVYEKHLRGSIFLAEALQNRLMDDLQVSDVRIAKAPLLVLIGADMPAVVVEIGHLTNPDETEDLKTDVFLTQIAKAISAAVDDFFANYRP